MEITPEMEKWIMKAIEEKVAIAYPKTKGKSVVGLIKRATMAELRGVGETTISIAFRMAVSGKEEAPND